VLSEQERAICAGRSNAVNYERINDLHYVGNYTRRLPVSLTRMMENAHDWEHLPHVHASSFSSIDLIDSGSWGWRAKLGVPSGGHQLIDLIVDMDRHYWVSTVLSGMGQGTEIHTQATRAADQDIDIDVRFYLPDAPADPAIGAVALQYLRGQYTQLYDEDVDLMEGRQSALNDRQRWRQVDQTGSETSLCLVQENALDKEAVHSVEWRGHRYALRFWNDQWIAHSAVCPHLLGPLDGGPVSKDGTITCPWHGYQFDILSGENKSGECKALVQAPHVDVRDELLYLRS
jgi:nitrite reductase/ring-hydroxylating ferredoxin subunit